MKRENTHVMKPVQLMNGVSGEYRGIRYRWESCENEQAVRLIILDQGKEVTLEETRDFVHPRFKPSYLAAAPAYIDLYLEKQEAEKEIEKLYLNAQKWRLRIHQSEVLAFYAKEGIPEEKAHFIAENYRTKLAFAEEFQHGRRISLYLEKKRERRI